MMPSWNRLHLLEEEVVDVGDDPDARFPEPVCGRVGAGDPPKLELGDGKLAAEGEVSEGVGDVR